MGMKVSGMLEGVRGALQGLRGAIARWGGRERRIAAGALAGTAALALGLAVYVSPYLAQRELQAALDSGDVARIGRLVDGAALRESLRPDVERVARAVALPLGPYRLFVSDEEIEALRRRLAERMLDEIGSERFLAATFQRGGGPSDPFAGKRLRIETMGYAGPGRFEIVYAEPGTGARATLVLARQGLLAWRVVALRMPPAFWNELGRRVRL